MQSRAQRQLNYLRHYRFGTLVEELTSALKSFLRESVELPLAIEDALVSELVYLSLRMAPFRKSALFYLIVADLQSSDFGLHLDDVERITGYLSDILGRGDVSVDGDGRSPVSASFALSEEQSDELLLDHLLWHIISAPSSDDAATELGVSRSLAASIKDFTKFLVTHRSTQIQSLEVDHPILERLRARIESYIDARSQQPWVLDIRYLGHLLRDHPSCQTERSLLHVLDWFSELGERGYGKKSHLVALAQLLGLNDQHDCGILEELLLKADLLYYEGSGRNLLMRLTQLGYRLTAMVYAGQFLRKKSAGFDSFHKLPMQYQVALARFLPRSRLMEVIPLLNPTRGVCGEAWTILLRRMSRVLDHELLFQHARGVMDSSTPWERRERTQSLRCLSNSKELQKAVAAMG